MKSLRRWLLERLVARRPRYALQLSCDRLGVTGLQLRLPAASPLYKSGGGETVELPVDEVITPFVLDHGHWQTEELDFLAAHAPQGPTIVVDVGANVGLITRQLVHRLPNIAAAVCFEPHPGNFRLLQRNLAHLPQCVPVQLAVGSEAGELSFYEEAGNAGNYSLNKDSMRGKQFLTSVVRCVPATEADLLGSLPAHTGEMPVMWKSDTQGFDEVIMTTLPDSFWRRVQCGVMEISRIERPQFDGERLAAILDSFAVRRFGDNPHTNVPLREILEFAQGRDNRHADLFFARS